MAKEKSSLSIKEIDEIIANFKRWLAGVVVYPPGTNQSAHVKALRESLAYWEAERLAHIEKSPRIIAVDFDGTVVEHKFPKVGASLPEAARVLRALQGSGCHIILWTMRHGDGLRDARRWFVDHNLRLFGVNKNPEPSEWTDSPKVFAHYYIDDMAVGCPLVRVPGERARVDWLLVEDFFIKEGILPPYSTPRVPDMSREILPR